MNKTKLLVRIISGILVTIMMLGLIVPYVSATETDEGADISVGASLESSNDGVQAGLEELYEILGEQTPGEVDDNPKPSKDLPDGFEYVDREGSWIIEKTSDNTKPAIIIDGMPYGFDTYVVTVFVGNLQTHEVKCYDLYNQSGYVASMDLEDGYYVIYANNYAWSDASGKTYAINGGEYQYIYIGDKYDEYVYGIEFESQNDIFMLNLEAAPDNMSVINYNESLVVTSADFVYPEDAKLEIVEESKNNSPTEPTNRPIDNTDDKKDDKDDKADNDHSFFGTLLEAIKDSIVWIVLFAICGIASFVIKKKKQIEIEKQTEIDKYDERRIN